MTDSRPRIIAPGSREHKDIKDNEAADNLSNLVHESEGLVAPAGLKTWSRGVRAEARGGGGPGLLGWVRKALSAYTWCRSDKGRHSGWLFRISKADSYQCRCGLGVMAATHVAEECPELEEWREALGG